MTTLTRSDLLDQRKPLLPRLEEHASRRRKQDRGVMLLALVLTGLVTGLAFLLVRSQEHKALRTALRLDGGDQARAIAQEMQLNIERVTSLQSLYISSDKVERHEFESFAAKFVTAHPAIQSLQWAPLVSHADREEFQATMRADDSPGYTIHESNADGRPSPAGAREVYCPVTFLVPASGNLPALGFDLLSQPDRRRALWAARDSGEVRATAGVQLIQGGQGVLLVAPIPRKAPLPEVSGETRPPLAGFCIGVFRLEKLANESLKSARQANLHLAIYDVTAAGRPQLLGFRPAPTTPGETVPQPQPEPPGPHHRTTAEIAGRTWLLVSAPNRRYGAAFPRWQSWSTLAGGGLLTAFLAFSFLQHRRHADQLESRVARRTSELAGAYRELEEEIAVRGHAELALRRSREQLDAIVNNTSAVIYLKDLEGRYLLVNERFKEIFQLTDQTILGRTDLDIFPKETAEAVRANDRRALAARTPLQAEEIVPHGSELHTYVSIKFPLHSGAGAPYAVCGISTDITERKRMEEALKASQQRYDLIINGIKDGIWDWNLITNEVYFSPHWKSMLGYADREIENNFAAWQKLLHPDDAERASVTIRAFLNSRRPVYELEHRLRHKDGTYRWILARGVAWRDSRGQPIRMAGSHVDLTDRKRAEEQLRQANLALEERQAMLGRALADLHQTHEKLQSTQLQLIQSEKLESIGKLAAGVAHEVKNPLQTMLMGLTYLESKLLSADEDVKLTCADMREAINRANTIVRGLLQMSGNPDLDMALEDINTVLERALWLVNYSLNASRITAVRHFDTALPRVWIDHGKMEQVFINLFTNAIHAMPKGGTLHVSTRTEPATTLGDRAFPERPPGRIVVQIQDTGTGISPENLSRLFTPFFTTKPNGLGTGLGLSVTKSIVELHGGRIELINAPDGGARATITLPAAKETDHEKSTHTVCG